MQLSSFFVLVLGDALLLFLALDLAVLFFVCGFLLGHLLLVLLVLDLEAVLGGLVDGVPHITDDFGDLCDFSSRVLTLHFVVHFSPIQEKCGEGPFGGGWLCYIMITLSEISFLPII